MGDADVYRVLICDRDAKWSEAVRARLQEAGLRVVRTPYRAPNANAYAERFVRSIKEECLNRLIPLGERHFRRAVVEFAAHYHRERNHQGLGNELIAVSLWPGVSAVFIDANDLVGDSITTSVQRRHSAVGLGADAGHYALVQAFPPDARAQGQRSPVGDHKLNELGLSGAAFSAFSEPWKARTEGSIGAHWGVLGIP
jgi:hypothetical protein